MKIVITMRSTSAVIQALFSLIIVHPGFGGLFGPPKGKLAFASTQTKPVNMNSIHESDSRANVFVEDTPALRQSVQRIYETWMQRRREDMLAQLQEEMSKNMKQATAFVRLLEEQLGTSCICEADPLICKIYRITC